MYYNFHTHRFGVASLVSLSWERWAERDNAFMEDMFFSLEIHPWKVKKTMVKPEIEAADFCKFSEMAALGEAGLDRVWAKTHDNWIAQLEVFAAAVEEGRKCSAPIVIHEVHSQSEVLAELKNYPGKIMIHHAAGTREKLEKYLEVGALLSFNRTPPDWVPLECLGLESDDAELEAYLPELYCATAKSREMELEKLREKLKENFFFFLGRNTDGSLQ